MNAGRPRPVNAVSVHVLRVDGRERGNVLHLASVVRESVEVPVVRAVARENVAVPEAQGEGPVIVAALEVRGEVPVVAGAEIVSVARVAARAIVPATVVVVRRATRVHPEANVYICCHGYV